MTYHPVIGWEDGRGVPTLEAIGVRPGHTVLDFGCRVGRYVFPAAAVVGDQGRVYAIDKEKDALEILKRKAAEEEWVNITPILTSGELTLEFDDATMDLVLVYDVMHRMSQRDRQLLMQEIARVLKTGGILSTMLCHTEKYENEQGDPGCSTDELIAEIEAAGLSFDRQLPATGVHFECDGSYWPHEGTVSLDVLEKETVFNFFKRPGR